APPPPPVKIQPAPPVQIQPVKPVKPVKQLPPAKEDKPADDAANAADKPARADAVPPAPPQGGGQGGQGGGFAPANPGPAIAPAPINWVPVEQGQIVLMPGKAKKADGKTSIRVRAAETTIPVAVEKDQFALFLELTVEPRLRWNTFGAVKITKAL